MGITTRRTLVVFGALLLATLAFTGYRLAASWSNLGSTMGGIAVPRSSGSGGSQPADPPRMRSATDNTASELSPAPNPAAPEREAIQTDLSQQALELRWQLRDALAQDPELLASLDEMLEEPDQDILRENLELLRDAFLTDLSDE